MKKLIPLEDAAYWMCQAVGADGVLSNNEAWLIRLFALRYGLEPERMLRLARECADNQEQEVAVIDHNQFAGETFEGYVVELFCRQCPDIFHLMRWRGDKQVGNLVAADTMLPDLEFAVSTEDRIGSILVECKYRRNDAVFPEFRHDQLCRYIEAEKESGMPVFVAVVLGGQPNRPGRLFIVPLWELFKKDRDRLMRYEIWDHHNPCKIRKALQFLLKAYAKSLGPVQ